MSTTVFKIALVLAIVAGTLPAIGQQRPPFIGPQPHDPGPNRAEVRFAMGKQPVTCKRFQLTAKAAGRTILAGSFVSGFSIPPAALTNHDNLDITLKCGEYKWHFSDVAPRAFLQGWWWVGTDYPPFQETFQGYDEFKDAVWIKYLIVDPTNDSGFDVYRFCPAKLKDQKPGPCYDDN
jgi:hypothetical protein